jgi:hypothetical protein
MSVAQTGFLRQGTPDFAGSVLSGGKEANHVCW